MRRLYLFCSLLMAACNLPAQDFFTHFADSTLRIDYTLAGNAHEQHLFVDALNRYPGWAGRRQHLDELVLSGNGQLIVRDTLGTVLYQTSFSSLFQEWICEAEAETISRSFEHCMQIPMPKHPVDVTLQLANNRHETTCAITHRVDPNDILIRHIGEKGLLPHRYLLKAENAEKAIDIAFLAEGYTAAEMEIFYKDAEDAVKALFEHEPFKKYKSRFNILAIGSASEDSGVSVPLNADWKRTAFSSHFSTFYSDRYLTSLHIKDIHNALAGFPYEHIIILANTETYGGGGIYNSYNLTSTLHKYYKQVVVHEFGHSFAGLGDEYQYGTPEGEIGQYPLDIEPWEQNITTKVDPMKASRLGNYEGAGYKEKGIWRYQEDCRMRTNAYPDFCPICQEALEKIILFYTE